MEDGRIPLSLVTVSLPGEGKKYNPTTNTSNTQEFHHQESRGKKKSENCGVQDKQEEGKKENLFVTSGYLTWLKIALKNGSYLTLPQKTAKTKCCHLFSVRKNYHMGNSVEKRI